jgi:hypothetical protein
LRTLVTTMLTPWAASNKIPVVIQAWAQSCPSFVIGSETIHFSCEGGPGEPSHGLYLLENNVVRCKSISVGHYGPLAVTVAAPRVTVVKLNVSFLRLSVFTSSPS